MAVRITVVGGANTDILGFPSGRYISRDSNPGFVRWSGGGVARNVAENLARLGAHVRLVTAFGDDGTGRWLRDECERTGIDTAYSRTIPGASGSSYVAVMDDSGDLAAAVNDMRVLDSMAPDMLEAAAFAGAHAVVLDTNLRASTILRATELAEGAPVILDPVSVTKALAARPVLGRLAAIKANEREAEEISGAAGAEGASSRLLESGVARVFVSMGTRGVLCRDADEQLQVPAPTVHVANATGAGDAFTAGVAYAAASGMGLRETAMLSSALASFALESERTVSEAITAESIAERMEAMSR